MDRQLTLPPQKEFHQPTLDACFVWGRPQLSAPAANLARRYTLDRSADVLAEGGAQLALRADEPDQEGAAACVQFMKGVWPDPDRRTFRPSFLRRAAYLE